MFLATLILVSTIGATDADIDEIAFYKSRPVEGQYYHPHLRKWVDLEAESQPVKGGIQLMSSSRPKHETRFLMTWNNVWCIAYRGTNNFIVIYSNNKIRLNIEHENCQKQHWKKLPKLPESK